MPVTGNNNFKSIINLTDDAFDLYQSGYCCLLLYISFNRLAFTVKDPFSNKFLVLRAYETLDNQAFTTQDILHLFATDNLLLNRFHETHIIMSSPYFTVIPNKYFQAGNELAFLTFAHGNLPPVQAFSEAADTNSTVLFAHPTELVEALQERIPNRLYFHHPLSVALTIASKHPAQDFIAISCKPKTFELLLAHKEQGLLFYNTFPLSSPSDVAYYYASVLQKFSLDWQNLSPIYLDDLTADAKFLPPQMPAPKPLMPYQSTVFSHKISPAHQEQFPLLFQSVQLAKCV